MHISLYKIRVSQKQLEVKQLQKKNQDVIDEVNELKRQKQLKERAELTNELMSDKNPEVVGYYKLKAVEKEKQIKNLTKRLRAYTLQEKRILMKERAYELEREDNIRKIINIQNQAAISRVYKRG